MVQLNYEKSRNLHAYLRRGVTLVVPETASYGLAPDDGWMICVYDAVFDDVTTDEDGARMLLYWLPSNGEAWSHPVDTIITRRLAVSFDNQLVRLTLDAATFNLFIAICCSVERMQSY